MRMLLTRRQGGLGDVVCLLPAVTALRAARPAARIDLALPPEYAALLAGRVHGVHVLAWDPRRFQPRWRAILEAHYDRVIDLAGSHGSASGTRPEPNRIDDFARRCGVTPGAIDLVPRLPVRAEERAWARRWLAARGIPPGAGPVVCLHLKSARPAKDWPLDKFAALARRLIDRDVRTVTLERTLRLDAPGIVGATRLSLPRAAALLAACDVLVGPDSGPMHLAAAVGTPGLALFGPTDPAVILRHYRRTHTWLRRPAVADIPVADVLAKIDERLAPGPGEGSGVPPPPPIGTGPRALYVSDRAWPTAQGDAERGMHRLLERLRARGWETVSRTWRPYTRRPVAEVIACADPDWVFTRFPVARQVVPAARSQDRPVAVFVDRRPNDARETLAAADRIVCESDHVRRAVEAACGPLPVVVQPPVVRPPRRAEAGRRHYLTVIRPGREGRSLFEALVRLLADREFLVVRAAALRVPWHRVARLPAMPSGAEVYRATRVLLAPSDGPPRAVVEAAAFGVPAVVGARGPLPEFVGRGGVVVGDEADPAAWAAAVAEVEARYDAYARRARVGARRFTDVRPLLRALETNEDARAGRTAREGGQRWTGPKSWPCSAA
jgi:ADP-heptose:LPS heptosyltransferase